MRLFSALEPMSPVATIVVLAFGLLLIAFTGVAFTNPVTAERFLKRFASSARTHYVEQVFRILVGAALLVLSPAMWQSKMFWFVGWSILVSSVALLCVPWRWHHRFGKWVGPILFRHLRLYAVGSFAFGALLLYGVFAGSGNMISRWSARVGNEVPSDISVRGAQQTLGFTGTTNFTQYGH
jgi:hypothetical protein